MLTVKGRYYPPGAHEDGNEKPLYLRVIPAAHAGESDESKQAAVDAAAAEIESILQGQPIRQLHQQKASVSTLLEQLACFACSCLLR